uniref:NADH-ubiquinone oxidoreductase chain 2 n=1 Tax=Bambusiphaga furca TaxID=2566015 RepID=A0A7S5DBJ4_9HEMI|nr:NADH dehydrogenase subunit 2 [Bambusiphaga furca]QBZ37952.1 NADH dehydrogenase subunit 2 [Bambusiphaga furca]
MKLNSSNFMCLMMMLTTTTMSLMINNWLFMWILMEINLFMFMPLMSKNKINDQSIKYFIIQSFSSHLLMFSILMVSILMMPPKNSLIVMIALMMKTGMAPLHLWLPEIMNKMKWNECLMLASPLKIIPMILMSKFTSMKMVIIPMMLSLMMGCLSGLNQTCLKKMMAFSSIFNLAWMISSFMTSKKVMLLFMMIYTSLNFKIMMFFKKMNIQYMNQINQLELKKKIKINMMILSLSGLPPMMGFFPKWMILKEMVMKSNIMCFTMIMTSLISMFMYMQISSFTFSNLSMKKKMILENKMSSINLINLMYIPIMLIFWVN